MDVTDVYALKVVVLFCVRGGVDFPSTVWQLEGLVFWFGVCLTCVWF